MTFNYWVPLGSPVRFSNLSGHQINFLATILLVATPFIWLGLAMTTKRLRDVGWPVWLGVLFSSPRSMSFSSRPFVLHLLHSKHGRGKARHGLDLARWIASSPRTA